MRKGNLNSHLVKVRTELLSTKNVNKVFTTLSMGSVAKSSVVIRPFIIMCMLKNWVVTSRKLNYIIQLFYIADPVLPFLVAYHSKLMIGSPSLIGIKTIIYFKLERIIHISKNNYIEISWAVFEIRAGKQRDMVFFNVIVFTKTYDTIFILWLKYFILSFSNIYFWILIINPY